MSEQIAAFLNSVERFVERKLPATARRELLDRGGWDRGLYDEFNELGWSLIARPDERDGLGLSLSSLFPLFETIGHHLLPGPLAEQIVLPALFDTPIDAILAIADPEVTFDWAEQIGGFSVEGEQLTGTIELVRFGAQATHLLCVASRRATSVPLLVLVPATDPLIKIEDQVSADPTARYARVAIANRPLNEREILAEGQQAAELLVRLRAWMRIFTACEMAGIARRVLADTVDYVGQRSQFGRPVGSFQALKHLLAGMAQATISLSAYCEAVARDADLADASALELAAWSLKAYAAEAARSVCQDGLQAHGGIGFTVEHDLHWFLRRALALRTWYGDEREMSRLVGKRRIDGVRSKAA